MRKTAKYNRQRAPGMKKSVVVNLGEGMNELFSPLNIRDGQVAKSRNFYSPDGISLSCIPDELFTDPWRILNTETVHAVATYNGDNNATGILPMMMNTSDNINWNASRLQGTTGTTYDLSSYNFSLSDSQTTHGALAYVSQAETYSIYWSTLENFFIVQAWSNRALSTVTLPTGVYPKQIIAHATRLFVLDTHNTLWWSKGGDYTTWFDDVDPADASYVFVASSDVMNQIISFNGALYIFGNESVFVFDGSTTDTFTLNQLFTGIGTYPYYEKSLTANRNMMYFVYKDKVYEFNGSAYPTMISEAVVSNGQITNGVTGGITPARWSGGTTEIEADWVFRALIATDDVLYLYAQRTTRKVLVGTSTYNMTIPTYAFDIKRHSWWMWDAVSYTTTLLVSNKTEKLTVAPGIGTDGKITWGCTCRYDLTSASAKISFFENTCFLFRNNDGVLTSNAYGKEFYAWFESKTFQTVLDGKFKLYGVDIVWRFTGLKTFNKLLSFGLSATWFADNYNITNTPLISEFIDGNFTNSNNVSLQTLVGEDWVYYWQSDVYNYWYPSPAPSFEGMPMLTKFVFPDGYTQYQSTPWARLSFLVQYSPIEILRIELKYREIGATR